MEVKKAIPGVNRVLGCVFVQLETEDKLYGTLLTDRYTRGKNIKA